MAERDRTSAVTSSGAMSSEALKVCWVVSSPLTVRAALLKHLAALSAIYNVTVVANTDRFDFLDSVGSRIRGVSIPIERKPQVLRDLWCVLRLAILLAVQRVAVVHSVTPKAGLVAMTAAWLARVPVRIHWCTGQVWVTRRGPIRHLLRLLDVMMAALSTHLLVDSPSQREFLVEAGICPREKMEVLGKGSICGVDLQRFCPNPVARAETRLALSIPSDAVVFLFVGRFTVDKGLLDLARAFAQLASERRDCYLLLVGPDEEGVWQQVLEACAPVRDRLMREEFTSVPERFMAAADVFCLPSYREGFGSVVIEAAAVGIPSIGSRIYGVTDAILEGETGLLHGAHDAQGLLVLMRRMATDEALRKTMGRQALERARKHFDREVVTAELVSYYARIVEGD